MQSGGGLFLKDTDKNLRKTKRFPFAVPVLIDVGDKILSAETKDISPLTLRLDRPFPFIYQGKSLSIVVKAKPAMQVRGIPLIGEADYARGSWDRIQVEPAYNFFKLIRQLEQEKAETKVASKPRVRAA